MLELNEKQVRQIAREEAIKYVEGEKTPDFFPLAWLLEEDDAPSDQSKPQNRIKSQ